MTITMTLSEVLDRCWSWDYFCEIKGYSVWAVNEGGGDVEVNLTEDELKIFGIKLGEINV